MLLLHIGESLLAGGSRSIAPTDIMKIAHRVDLKHVRENRHHEHVRSETKDVILEVLAEVERAHNHWQYVDGQHDDTCQAKRAEIGFISNVLPSAWGLGVSRVLHTLRDRWIQATLCQEVADSNQ